jgi:hypothetical protein
VQGDGTLVHGRKREGSAVFALILGWQVLSIATFFGGVLSTSVWFVPDELLFQQRPDAYSS